MKGDGEARMILAVALALGKYPHDVARQMTMDQVSAVFLYLDILNEERSS